MPSSLAAASLLPPVAASAASMACRSSSATCSASGRSARAGDAAGGVRAAGDGRGNLLDAGFAQHFLQMPAPRCAANRCASPPAPARCAARGCCRASSAPTAARCASAPSSGGAEPLRSAMSSASTSTSAGMSAPALAQRRHADRQHVQAVVQVLAELALAHQRREVARSGGDHAGVEGDDLVGAQRLDLAFLQARAAAWAAGWAACRRSRRGTACRRRPA